MMLGTDDALINTVGGDWQRLKHCGGKSWVYNTWQVKLHAVSRSHRMSAAGYWLCSRQYSRGTTRDLNRVRAKIGLCKAWRLHLHIVWSSYCVTAVPGHSVPFSFSLMLCQSWPLSPWFGSICLLSPYKTFARFRQKCLWGHFIISVCNLAEGT